MFIPLYWDIAHVFVPRYPYEFQKDPCHTHHNHVHPMTKQPCSNRDLVKVRRKGFEPATVRRPEYYVKDCAALAIQTPSLKGSQYSGH